MLTIYRRHKKTCPHRTKGRAWRRCACPYWVDGSVDGIEIRESLRVHTGEDAEQELGRLKARLKRPQDASEGPVSLADAWDQFTLDCNSRQLREPTLNKYRYLRTDMERFAVAEGLRFVAEFNLERLGKWRASWVNRNLSAVKKLELVRCFLRFCQDRGWTPDNPARKLKAPNPKPKQTMPYTREEVVRIIAAPDLYKAVNPRNRRRLRALVLLLRHSGLRIGDAVTLPRERISDGKLFLYTSKAGTPVYCPLPPFLITALEAAIEVHDRFYFWSGNGKPKSAISDWQEKIKRVCELANVSNGHAHRFRDTFATELLLAGVPLERVSILLGHSSIRITERHYSPWVRSRQEQLERDVRATWTHSGLSSEGTPEVHAGSTRPN